MATLGEILSKKKKKKKKNNKKKKITQKTLKVSKNPQSSFYWPQSIAQTPLFTLIIHIVNEL